MKKILYIGIAAAILGCTKSEELSTSTSDAAISFSVGEIVTRVTDGGTTLSWDSGEQINITDGTKSAIYTITNTSTGAMSYYNGDGFYTYGNSEQTFYGWSLSSPTPSDGKFSIDLSDQSAVSQIVVGKATTTTATATLTFTPIYTKVIFNVTSDGKDLSEASVSLTGVNVKGSYDYAAGKFYDLEAEDMTPTMVVDSEDSSKATITLYVLENTAISSELTITIGDDSFVTLLSGKKWYMGELYEYNLTVWEY